MAVDVIGDSQTAPQIGSARTIAVDDLLTPGRFAFLLVLLVFAQFPQVVMGLQTFVVRDYGFFAYPLAQFQKECFWQGQIPSWNPYNNCGVPFLAQWNTMPLYPPALIYLLLPLTWSLSFFCLFHLWLAGMGMYFLAYRWTGNRVAAAAAGVMFAFNGLTLNLLMWPSHIATLSWMPWVVLTGEKAWKEGGRSLVGAALTGSMQMLAGGPETILFTWIILSSIWIWEIYAQIRQGKGAVRISLWRTVFRLPILVVLISCLCAPQLLPFLDLTAHSQRDVGYADNRWAMPPWGWANFLVPMAFGKTWSMGVFFQYFQSWTSSYYLPIGGLLLAGLGAWMMRTGRTWLLAAIAAFGLIMAFGDVTVAFKGIRWAIPQLSMITNPVKFVTLTIFAAPLLAAYGISRMQKTSDAKAYRSRIIVFGAVLLWLIGGILVWAKLYPFPSDDFGATLINGLQRGGLLVIEGALLIALVRKEKEPRPFQRILPVALVVVLWFDVLRHEPNQNPTISPSVYEEGLIRARLEQEEKNPQPVLGKSRAMLTTAAEAGFTGFIVSDPKNNFLVKRLGYFCNCNLLDRVPKVNGFFSLYPSHSSDITSIMYSTTDIYPKILDFLSVSELTKSGQNVSWVTRDTWLPEITAGQRPIFLDRARTLAELTSTSFDPANVVMLTTNDRPFVTVTNQTEAKITTSEFGLHKVQFEIEAKAPSLAVISQTYYHLWQAYIDEKPARLLRANHAFQAVEVPAGTHWVRLVYRDDPFRRGMILMILALCACALVWFRYPNASQNAVAGAESTTGSAEER